MQQTPGSPPPVQHDIGLLLPAFQPKVRALLDALTARGLDPVLFETLRTPERGEYLEATGKSRNGAKSMHCYGCAADFISHAHGWQDRSFFTALGEEADKLGLSWGGHWSGFVDLPHVQAVPIAYQNQIRGLATPEDRNALLVRFFAGETEWPVT